MPKVISCDPKQKLCVCCKKTYPVINELKRERNELAEMNAKLQYNWLELKKRIAHVLEVTRFVYAAQLIEWIEELEKE